MTETADHNQAAGQPSAEPDLDPTIRSRAAAGLGIGDCFEVQRTFTPDLVRAFGDLSRDFNPIHYDEEFARSRGFTGLISHGLLVGCLMTEIGGQIGWLAGGMDFKFLKPVYLGQTVRCRLTLVEVGPGGRARAEGKFINQGGELVAEVVLTGRLPNAEQRRILARSVEPSVGDSDSQKYVPVFLREPSVQK